MNVTADDILHDIFLCTLGNYQASFVCSKLDDFLNNGEIRNIDIPNFVEQLTGRAKISEKRAYTPANTQEFKQEDRYRLPPPDKNQKSDNMSNAMNNDTANALSGSRPVAMNNENKAPGRYRYIPGPGDCSCGRGRNPHKEEDCWLKHPEKKPFERWLNALWQVCQLSVP
jgi:hypothetical protein